MKYLFINAYSAKNRGDAGIVVAMIHLIRKHDPNSQISVMSSYCEENKSFYESYNVQSVESVWNLQQKNTSIKRYLNGLAMTIKGLVNPKAEKFRHYHNADVVISVGGGYLYSSRKGSLGVGLLNSLFHIWLGTRLNKRVLGFPQSVGPLNGNVDKTVVKHVLKKVETFISREKITTELLMGLGLSNVIEIPDIGFTVPKEECHLPFKQKEKELKIGLTLLDWRFAKKNATESHIEEYIQKIATACKLLDSKYGNCHFYIVPQVTVGTGDSDLEVSIRLSELLGTEKSSVIELDQVANTPEKLVYLYSQMDLFIGSRMHSTIFALAGGVPTIALAYQYKTRGTFSAMGLDDYVFSVEDFNEKEVFEVMDKIITENNYPVKEVKNKIKIINRNILDSLHN